VSGEATPTPTVGVDLATKVASDPQVRSLEKVLEDQRLSKEARKSVELKIEMAKRMAAQQAAGAILQKGIKQAPPLPTRQALIATPVNVPDQIFEGSQGMIRPSTAEISNCWQGLRNGKIWEIYAGTLTLNPNEGALIIFSSDAKTAARTMRIAKGPANSGALRILSVEGGIVILQPANGSTLKFSMQTMAFEE
jgi:hypothetical protein